MDNTLYLVQDCPFCAEMEKAVVLANCTLPLNQKIDFVDVYSGDSRVNYLNAVVPGNVYALPKMILDVKNNDNGKILLSRYMIDSTSTKEYDFNFINLLLNNNITFL